MILATAPIIQPGRKGNSSGNIVHTEESIQNVVVKAEANNLIRFDENIKCRPGSGEKDIEFTFRAGDETGVAT